MSRDRTFWPYGILLSLLAVIIACVVTIIFANDYPVYEDDFYLDKYQNIDYNFNQIQQKQARFEELFRLSFENEKLTITGKRKIKSYEVSPGELLNFKLEKLKDLDPVLLRSEVLLTRPHQNTENQLLQAKIEKELLSIRLPLGLERGRWQLKLKLRANDEAVGFYSFELRIE